MITLNTNPFPCFIAKDFYNKTELELIWEELNFYTRPEKLLDAKDYGGVVDSTNAKALCLDSLYNDRNISNILRVNRKIFSEDIKKSFSKLHDCCETFLDINRDETKVRYYHNGDYYKPHIDARYQFVAFTYFYREPKRFSGGELVFPKYNYEFPCYNNSIIIFPGWVEHGVREVSIENSDYYDGWGRYCISSFLDVN